MVAPGGTITIYGHGYTSTCNDTGQGDPLVPLEPVRLTLVLPGGRTEDVGTFEPHGESMGFSATITIPRGTSPGHATVDDGLAVGSDYTFGVDAAGVSDATIVPTTDPDPVDTSQRTASDHTLRTAVLSLLAVLAAITVAVVLRRSGARTR